MVPGSTTIPAPKLTLVEYLMTCEYKKAIGTGSDNSWRHHTDTALITEHAMAEDVNEGYQLTDKEQKRMSTSQTRFQATVSFKS